jgi:2-polyprenyl-3-methyl-5-hydroxy-6-metoxy-1,4-benzoquinol methylase
MSQIPYYFDWKFYLEKYPDLKNFGINSEELCWYHYVKSGANEDRLCNSYDIPAVYRYKVSGTKDPSYYYATSQQCFGNIINSIAPYICLSPDKVILDWGVGCGRVLQQFLRNNVVPHKNLYGVDADYHPIEYLKTVYPKEVNLDVINELPPTKFNDGTFDFIYAISILSHLPEDALIQWLAEIHRILKSGGIFYFSTHGEQFKSGDQMTFDKSASDYLNHFTHLQYYGVAMTPKSYMEKKIKDAKFELLSYTPNGYLSQDVIVVRKN